MLVSSIREPLHIIGAGSIGMLLAASLRTNLPSNPVHLLLRDHHRGQQNDSSFRDILWRRPGWDTPREISLPVQYVTDEIDETIQTLIVATKAYQAKEAVQSVIHRLRAKASRVIVLCNGTLAVKEELAHILSPDIPLILATTTHGVYQESSILERIPSLVHAGVGQTFVQDTAKDLAKLFEEAELHCSSISAPDMDKLLWKKLAANCVINPLTALYRCKNGDLLIEPSFPQLGYEIVHEVANVATATFERHREDYDNSNLAGSQIDENELREFVGRVIQGTRNNRSSMLQDVLQNKRTEIGHLNGYIIKKGRELGIDCPTNEDIVSRFVETSSK